MWDNNAWIRHLELSKSVKHYASCVGIHYYPLDNDCALIFLDADTGREWGPITLSEEQASTLWYGAEAPWDVPGLPTDLIDIWRNKS